MDMFCKRPLIIDGGMGTMLQSLGLPPGASPDAWNLEEPQKVEQVHSAYIQAGARLITANTFGSNPPRQKRGKYPPAELAAAGVRLAKQAAAKAPEQCYVALDVGPLGLLMEPMGELTQDEAEAYFAETILGGVAAGPDCILIETMCDLEEALAALRAAKAHGGGLPVFCTLSFDQRGRLITGMDAGSAARALTEAGADAIGCNCGVGPEQLLPLLPLFLSNTDLPVILSPNAGLPVFREGRTCYDLTPEAFAASMRVLFQEGACGLGGCCGTTPAHIQALVKACG